METSCYHGPAVAGNGLHCDMRQPSLGDARDLHMGQPGLVINSEVRVITSGSLLHSTFLLQRKVFLYSHRTVVIA